MKFLTEWKKARLEKKREEFVAKLKYGSDWHYKLYPHKYTSDAGPH